MQEENELEITPQSTADGTGFQFGTPKLPVSGFRF